MKSKKELEILRAMSYSDLVKELKEARKQIFESKMKRNLTGEFKPHMISILRKKIARIKYLMHSKRSDQNEAK